MLQVDSSLELVYTAVESTCHIGCCEADTVHRVQVSVVRAVWAYLVGAQAKAKNMMSHSRHIELHVHAWSCSSTWGTTCRRLGFNPDDRETGNIAFWLQCHGPLPQSHSECSFQLWIKHRTPAATIAIGKLDFAFS